MVTIKLFIKLDFKLESKLITQINNSDFSYFIKWSPFQYLTNQETIFLNLVIEFSIFNGISFKMYNHD